MTRATVAIAGGDTATPLNLEKRLRLIAPYLVPGESRVLDCGCGEGDYVIALRRRFDVEAVGIEYLTEKVAAFQAANPGSDWVTEGDIQSIGFPDASFDVAILNEVLEHVPDEARGIEEIRRVLKPGGVLLVFSPNRFYPFESHGVDWKRTGKRVPPYVPGIPYIPVALGRTLLHYWARNYWPWELRGLLRDGAFEVESAGYVWQTFENISGKQPSLLRVLRPLLRRVSAALERTPGLRMFGVSQFLVARRLAT